MSIVSYLRSLMQPTQTLPLSPVVSAPPSNSITLPTTAFVKPSRRVNKVFLHCSASDKECDDDWKVIDSWHRARGFNGIGYHYFIKKDGTLQTGRNLEQDPASQEGYNKNSISICLHGLAAFTDKEFDTLRNLCFAINAAFKGAVTFHGHREVNPNKTCPVYDYVKVLGLDANGSILT